jgi:hypothetical protein
MELAEAIVAVKLGEEESTMALHVVPLNIYPLTQEAVAATVLAGVVTV